MDIKKTNGFSLTELMITIAIIGILAGLSYPTYLDYVRGSIRHGAQGALERLASEMLRSRSTTATHNFAGLTNDNGTPISTLFPSQLPLDSETKTHTITITLNATANQFTLTATPIEGSTMEYDGALTLSSTGAKTWNGASGWE